MHSNEEKCVVPYGDGLSKTYGVWLSGLSECEWYGVTCSADGVVRALDLIQNDLVGTIPHELAALNSLQLLAFPYNVSYCTTGALLVTKNLPHIRFFDLTVHLWNNVSSPEYLAASFLQPMCSPVSLVGLKTFRNWLVASPAVVGIARQRVERNHTRFV